MKPEHIIIRKDDILIIDEIGLSGNPVDAPRRQVDCIYRLIQEGRYSVIDYELLLRTAEHEREVKDSRRHVYLDDQRDRFKANYSVAEQGPLYMPVDLGKAVYKGFIDDAVCGLLLSRVKKTLRSARYDGSLLKASDLLLAVDSSGKIMNNSHGEPEVIICNFELIGKISDYCGQSPA